jgi:hypothetical protein
VKIQIAKQFCGVDLPRPIVEFDQLPNHKRRLRLCIGAEMKLVVDRTRCGVPDSSNTGRSAREFGFARDDYGG